MSCKDCEKMQAGDGSAFFRWGTADIELRGCGKHVGEVMAALRFSKASTADRTKPEGK